MSQPENHTPAWAIVAAWLFVGIPLAWGVYQTVMKSMNLFQ